MKRIIVVLLVSLPTFLFSQAGSEIYLVDMKVKGDEIKLSNPVNITNHKGYDNQPMFAPDAPIIYYTSDRRPGKGAKWNPIVFMHDEQLMQGISRLAVNKSNSKMCIVVKENNL